MVLCKQLLQEILANHYLYETDTIDYDLID